MEIPFSFFEHGSSHSPFPSGEQGPKQPKHLKRLHLEMPHLNRSRDVAVGEGVERAGGEVVPRAKRKVVMVKTHPKRMILVQNHQPQASHQNPRNREPKGSQRPRRM